MTPASSLKKAKKFKGPKDSENAQLVTNLSYTFSVTRIAHYLKCIMRDNIGSTADGPYIQKQITAWIMGYVTKVTNPDDLTLRYYPFKAATVNVTAREGQAGWYDCQVAILPHIQFEGMDVEMVFTVYDYDLKAKVYYKSFHCNDEALKGLIQKAGGSLSIDIADEPSTEVVSPANYAFSLAVMPQDLAQTLHMAFANDMKQAKQWGVTVGA